MKHRFKILFAIILLVIANNLKSEEIKQYKLINDLSSNDFAIYIFSNYPECISCIESTRNIILSALDLGFSEFTYISNNQAPQIIQSLNKYEKINLATVHDGIGLYHKYYEIEYSNNVLIFDSEGYLLFKGNFSLDTLFANKFVLFLNSLNNEENHKIELVSKVVLTNDMLPVLGDDIYLSLYSQKNNEYFILNALKSIVYRADSTGKVISSINLNDKFDLKYPNYNLLSWQITDSVFLIPFDTYLPEINSVKNFTFRYFCYSDSVELTSLPFKVDSLKYRTIIKGNTIDSGFVLINTNSKSSNFNKEKPFKLIDKNYQTEFGFGKFDLVFEKLNLWVMYYCQLTNDENYIYALQSNSLNLRKYNLKGDFVGTIVLKKPKHFRINQNYNKKTTWSKLDFLSYENISSLIRYIKVDEKNKKILLTFKNSTYPINNPNPIESDILIENYMCIFSPTGEIEFETKLTGRYVKVIDFIDDYFIVSKITNSKLIIEKYRITH